MTTSAGRARRAAAGLVLAGLSGGASAVEEPTMDERIRQIVEGPLVVAVAGGAPAEVRRGVRYTAEGDGGPALDLYLPPAAGAGRRGAWIFVHGGPLPPGMDGALRQPRDWRFFRDYGELAAAAGRVGVVLGHRFAGLEGVERSAADLRAGITWVRAHANELGIDAERLSLWLFSGAGVHLPSLLAAPPAGVHGVVAFYPVVEVAALAAMGMGPAPERAAEPPLVVDASRTPRLFVARAGLDHPALNAALDRFVATALSAGLTLELAHHARGHHGFELFDDDARSREIVECALRFLVRGESDDEPAPRVVRPARHP
jgi:acetyl esterase/lipase